ncbi:MAG: hypothetical protein A3B89_03410 [Candidatus Buchananbacteria bacterium RIFCSPHIGHO2_02_FULL_40_13]|uniref:Uncharacterized protein n=1 Tax=Candidatus Buchananbacteria bacterium RIFCSPLOWO2_01_FULL_39_33 TaxID=1797543 RepID=A0A1G1YHI9_9BACT|nr:MAG: hypothetical protein A3B89_03410 [Candidatus Buchananbacteria bacterium RIFCSPHIGHO2_02_FULL_40_13]OGY51779.1 MAG: hypothetical protein A3A02_04085 [Candidatus Buchananbacteria bacterium RIFCSPLOWO2_01_FULL_39_33]
MITLATLLEIAQNPGNISISSGGPINAANGTPLYFGWIAMDNGKDYKPLIRTAPIFKTDKEAVRMMREIVNFIHRGIEKVLKSSSCPLRVLTCQSPEEFESIRYFLNQAN